MFTYLSYDDIAFRIDAMIETIRQENFSSLVVIVRGGIFPGIHLSVRTGLPIYYLKYERNRKMQTSHISWIGSAPSRGKILLCEDMAGSGKTLIESRHFLEEQGLEVQSFVVYKDTYSASKPEFFCYSTDNPKERFVVPWEKEKFNPNFPSIELLQDHEYEFTGWEIYGTIYDYDRRLNGDDRNTTSLSVLGSQDVIITGTTIEDKEEILSWLNRSNLLHPVYFRDKEELNPTSISIALWKGKKAVEIGCTRYVESDVEQAIFISEHFPHLEVIWWNNGKPISIKASSFSKIS
ncbi:phosphoribosyltransferase [Bacillus sp. BRMEA1]|uniref:phosphoribosyltransferase n=1 Tax=Neobacillus endophyticus TaxID=2738405 RepID=UPI0015654D33|nr:phosphoribosyltransferase [Neobacillus endophyticus]NRD76644.1 phosphoribosyltransferase [Neobacillus endophyticus]